MCSDNDNRELILLVDDDASGRAVRKLVLELHHHKVTAVGEANSALRVLKTEPVRLVIVDYFLEGITGTELARQMRELKPEMPILLLSGSGEVLHGIEYVDKYLCKLDSIDTIEKSIAELIRRRAPELDPSPIASSAPRRPKQKQKRSALLGQSARNQ